jgi:hypothetical protein
MFWTAINYPEAEKMLRGTFLYSRCPLILLKSYRAKALWRTGGDIGLVLTTPRKKEQVLML